MPYEHEPAAEGESAEPGFTILNEKSLAYYEGLKAKGEPVYIETIPYEDFMLLVLWIIVVKAAVIVLYFFADKGIIYLYQHYHSI